MGCVSLILLSLSLSTSRDPPRIQIPYNDQTPILADFADAIEDIVNDHSSEAWWRGYAYFRVYWCHPYAGNIAMTNPVQMGSPYDPDKWTYFIDISVCEILKALRFPKVGDPFLIPQDTPPPSLTVLKVILTRTFRHEFGYHCPDQPRDKTQDPYRNPDPPVTAADVTGQTPHYKFNYCDHFDDYAVHYNAMCEELRALYCFNECLQSQTIPDKEDLCTLFNQVQRDNKLARQQCAAWGLPEPAEIVNCMCDCQFIDPPNNLINLCK